MSAAITMLDGATGALALHELPGNPDASNALLICHANGFNGPVYRAFAAAIDADVRVFALDFRGHGDSDTPTGEDGFAWSGMTNDVLTAIDHLHTLSFNSIHGFGHSLGGAAMIDAERQSPETFASLMVFEPVIAPQGTFDRASPLVRSAEGRLRSFPSAEAALMRYAARPPLGLFRADVLYDYVRHGFTEQTDGTVTLKCAPESEAEVFRGGAQTIHLDLVADVQANVVVAVSGDKQFAGQLAAPIVEQLPNGELIEFPTLTHFGPLQDPVGVANTMSKIIASAEAN